MSKQAKEVQGRLLKDQLAGGSIGETKQGNNIFLPAKGELAFTPLFQDDDQM